VITGGKREGSSPPDLVVVGSVALDDIHTPWEHRRSVLGGSATYAALAAAPFCRTGLVGVVGEDFPEEARVLLQERGVDTRGLESRPGRTFHWEGRYEANMEDRTTLCTELNVFADFQPELPPEYRDAPYVFLANIAPALQLQVLDQLPEASFVAADTMDLWIRTTADDLAAVLGRVDLLTLNESEARLLTGERSLRRAAARIRERGPGMVLVKKGESGSVLFAPDRILFIPAYPLEEVRDPTGAGDSFAGAMMGELASRRDRETEAVWRAAITGSSVASFAVEEFGAEYVGRLDREAIERRRAELLAMICV